VSGTMDIEQYDHFIIEIHGNVALVYINRPEKMNSMTVAFWPQLQGLLGTLSGDGDIRVVVITGRGDRAFSAGGDIGGFGEMTTLAERRSYMTMCMGTFAAVENCRLPVIAAVNGWAFGGGCELTLACDIALAAESATFAMPETSVGLVPGFGVQRAPSVIGRQWTKYLVFAGERIDAETAHRLGMVQRVVPDAELLEYALRLGAEIAEQAPLAVEVAKRIINRDIHHSQHGYSIDAVSLLYSTADAAEGVRAFSERRRPRFEGR
jgi:enoyl-CoA hydratase